MSSITGSQLSRPPKLPNRLEKLPRRSPSGGRDGTTIGTREEDLNIDEFMKADMNEVNKEEDKL